MNQRYQSWHVLYSWGLGGALFGKIDACLATGYGDWSLADPCRTLLREEGQGVSCNPRLSLHALPVRQGGQGPSGRRLASLPARDDQSARHSFRIVLPTGAPFGKKARGLGVYPGLPGWPAISTGGPGIKRLWICVLACFAMIKHHSQVEVLRKEGHGYGQVVSIRQQGCGDLVVRARQLLISGWKYSSDVRTDNDHRASFPQLLRNSRGKVRFQRLLLRIDEVFCVQGRHTRQLTAPDIIPHQFSGGCGHLGVNALAKLRVDHVADDIRDAAPFGGCDSPQLLDLFILQKNLRPNQPHRSVQNKANNTKMGTPTIVLNILWTGRDDVLYLRPIIVVANLSIEVRMMYTIDK